MFDWRDFLELGRALGSGAPGTTTSITRTDATARSAVGRACYAAFGHARAYAVQHFGFVSTGTAADHGRLAAHFRAHGMRHIARRLSRLRDWRNECDYEDVVPTLPVIVGRALRDATIVIQGL